MNGRGIGMCRRFAISGIPTMRATYTTALIPRQPSRNRARFVPTGRNRDRDGLLVGGEKWGVKVTAVRSHRHWQSDQFLLVARHLLEPRDGAAFVRLGELLARRDDPPPAVRAALESGDQRVVP